MHFEPPAQHTWGSRSRTPAYSRDGPISVEGYLPPEAIAERVKVKGRGGTVLQPGIDLLERAEDFPRDGPLLIITDGFCDRLRVARSHAYLLPQGRTLPIVARGPVFRPV